MVLVPRAEVLSPFHLGWQSQGAPRASAPGNSHCTPTESVIGLFKTEVIRGRGPWRNIDEVEFAVLEWVDWFNNRRLLEPLGYVPPAEYEAAYYRTQETPAMVAGLM